MIGFDPKEARQGNLAIDVALLGFFIIITIWLKAFIIIGVGSSLILITPSFLFVFRWPYH
jgi:hypothetical protein